jgi:hypothetical protein
MAVTKNERRHATRVIGTLFVVLSLHTAKAAAQGRFDVALMLGSTGATDAGPTLQFDRGKTYQATFAWRVWGRDAVTLAVEVPFIASPAFNVVRADRPTYAYASLYLTPGVRVAAFPRRTVSVFGVGGVVMHCIPRVRHESMALRIRSHATRTPMRFSLAAALMFGHCSGWRFEARCATSIPAHASSQSRRPANASTT